jgi:hypothetical protein
VDGYSLSTHSDLCERVEDLIGRGACSEHWTRVDPWRDETATALAAALRRSAS